MPVVDLTEVVNMDTITIDANSPREIYRASEKRVNDLLHTKLEVSFNWDSAFLYGRANLRFKPYFYPTNSLVLDAKGFQVNEVSLVDQIGKKSPLKYSYDKEFLSIELDKTYTRKDTYEIFIDYVAMPDKLAESGSAAITSEKGLYFINKDGSIPDKPKQIWTQGETESSSCWFPTIDSPNEKTTQEIYMTVDSNYVTLSNGELIFQTENPDGTRTDFWKQDLPHAPYLFMMAVGEFAVVEDSWREKPVNYYVEPKYEPYAKDIYANTPEMLEFFSNKLGYDYPWDKYHQIVVRDYVSGAMENTGAVIYGAFVQGDDRYLIDNSGEDVVAHELFHHWFGDLVTCESWSNLPLNESFATYGEYLWNEYKYGKDQADYHGWGDLKAHLSQARINKKKMIRFHYERETEMFDSHSYQKGGRILHMLRNYVGDDAFFESLQLYLKSNEFQTVEMHQLRLAFEEVTGEDLNWFFNQWFYAAGHPILEVNKSYNAATDTLTVLVEQTQDGGNVPDVFEIYTDISVLQADGTWSKNKVHLTKRIEAFTFKFNEAPRAVLFDADRVLLGEVAFEMSEEEAIASYGGNFLTKYDAIESIKRSSDSLALNIIEKALKDDFWFIRKTGIDNIKNLATTRPTATLQQLKLMAEEDDKSNVRAAAISKLSQYFSKEVDLAFFERGINDRSFLVVSASLNAIYNKNETAGIRIAESLESEENANIQLTISELYALEGDPKRAAFYEKSMDKMSGFRLYSLLTNYGKFLEKQDNNAIEKALPQLNEIASSQQSWFIRMSAINPIIKIKKIQDDKITDLEKQLAVEGADEIKLNDQLGDAKALKVKLTNILSALNKTETNANLKRMLGAALN